MKHTIYTEQKNMSGMHNILSQHFPEGYTITYTIGFWKGNSELSVAITIVGANPEVVQAAALDIKQLNSQESMLVVSTPCEVTFL